MGGGILYENMVADELRKKTLREITVAGVNLASQISMTLLRDQPLSPIAAEFVRLARAYRDQKLDI
jgi:hypothetical protein